MYSVGKEGKMKKYPFVKQVDARDCGASCLSMIIKYYGGYINLEALKEMTHTSKIGVNAYNIVQTLEKIGFHSDAYKVDFNSISDVLLPCIAHVTINGFNHYIVIYKINFKTKKIIIGDPGTSIKTISFDEFKSIWNGTMITMYPRVKIPYEKDKITPINFIMYFFKGDLNLIFNLVIISIFICLFSIAGTYYFQFIIDGINKNKDFSYIVYVFVSFLFIGLLKEISEYIRGKITNYLNYKITLKMNTSIFRKIVFLPFRYYSERSSGDVVSRINDLNNVISTISEIFINGIVFIFVIVFSSILLFITSEKLFLISLLFVFLYSIIVLVFRKYFSKKIDLCQNLKALETSYLVEVIKGYNTVKGANLFNYVISKYNKKHIDFSNNFFKLRSVINSQAFLKNIINITSYLFIIFEGVKLISDGNLTLGALVTFNYLFSYFCDPIKSILDFSISISQIKSSIKRITDLYYYDDNVNLAKDVKSWNIKINKLDFAYNYTQVLKEVNIDINYGDKIMVIGNSGSGKSTLFKLLLQYYEIGRNKILIDNIDINDIQNSTLHENICYISQNEVLFTDSLYNNLILDKTVDMKKINEVVNDCFLNNVVNKSNLGYKVLVEDDGFNFSGGEKKRISLARALLRNTDILILDEPLANLDDTTTERIEDLLLSIKNKTMIIVSHQFSLTKLSAFDDIIDFSKL